MTRPSLPYCFMRRRARERTSMALSAGVSSMTMGASLRRPSAMDSLSQSSAASRPVRSLCWSRRPTEPIIRSASCVAPISMENTATGRPVSSATFSPMLMASAVLPMLGLPATTIRSPGCSPDVILSRSVKPVGTPVTSDGSSRLYSVSMRSTTCASSLPISWKFCAPREPCSAMCRTFASASSSTDLASRPSGRYADSAISAAVAASWRRIERSRTMLA